MMSWISARYGSTKRDGWRIVYHDDSGNGSVEAGEILDKTDRFCLDGYQDKNGVNDFTP